MPTFDPPLDAGIQNAVEVLVAAGIETFESCEGGDGHAFAVPTVRFHGGYGAGFRALAVTLDARLPVAELNRSWSIINGEPNGLHWLLTFS